MGGTPPRFGSKQRLFAVAARTVHTVPDSHDLAPLPKYNLNTERVSENESYIFADILHWHYSEAVAIICAAITR